MDLEHRPPVLELGLQPLGMMQLLGKLQLAEELPQPRQVGAAVRMMAASRLDLRR